MTEDKLGTADGHYGQVVEHPLIRGLKYMVLAPDPGSRYTRGVLAVVVTDRGSSVATSQSKIVPIAPAAGSLSMTRRARPGEMPEFGQVWSWRNSEWPILVTIGTSDPEEDGTIRLIGIRLDPVNFGGFNDSWFWTERDGKTMTEWILRD